MKAKTKKNVGFATAVIMLIVGVYQLLFSTHSLMSLLGLLDTTILSAIYVFALARKKLGTAQVVYRTWWVIWVICLGIASLGTIIAGIWAESLQNVLAILFALFCCGFLFGLMTFLWWIGLRGLESMVKTETNLVEESLQNTKNG